MYNRNGDFSLPVARPMIDNRIRLRHLQCFLAIAQHRSVGRAAEAISITQPALSKTLHELEGELGVRLFERTAAGMLLTRFGEVFVRHAVESVSSLRRGVESIRFARDNSSMEVSIGALPTVTAAVMPHAVRRFKQDFADITVRVVNGEHAPLLDLLRGGELDFVVGRLAQPENMIGLSFEELYVEPLMIVVRHSHPLAKYRRFKLPMVADYPCVLPYRGTTIRHEIDRYLLARGVPKLNDVVETGSPTFGHTYTRERNAVWFVAAGIVSAELRRRTLVELPVDTRLMQGSIGITTKVEGGRTSSAEAMIDAVRHAAQFTATPRR